MEPTIFDPSHQYGNFVVVGCEHEHSVLDDVVRDEALKVLKGQMQSIIPKALQGNVTYPEYGPTWMENPYEPPGPDNGAWTFSVGWRFNPTRATRAG